MIIVAGTLKIKSGHRDEFIEKSLPAIRQARELESCHEFTVSADPIEIDTVCIFERWESQVALEQFRENGPAEDLSALIDSYSINEYGVNER